MARDPIFGQLHPDVACAIALGIVENTQVTITLDSLTLFDPRVRANRTQTAWLGTDDALDVVTREYLTARRDAMLTTPRASQSGWAGASAVKARDGANSRAVQARARGWEILQQRGVVSYVRRLGLTVNPPA